MTDATTPAPTLAGKDYFTQAEAAAYACVSLSQFRARADEYGIRPVLCVTGWVCKICAIPAP